MINQKTLCCLISVLLFLSLLGACSRAATYSATMLQTPAGLGRGMAHAVNDSGQIVGAVSDSLLQNHPLAWNPDGSAHTLALPAGFVYGTALDINASGQCVGIATDSTGAIQHGIMWDAAGNPTDLGAFDGKYSVARCINKYGEIVGYSGMPDGSAHVVIWDSSGHITDLGLLGRGDGINDSGQICGEVNSGAFLLAGSQFTDLGALTGDDPYMSEAFALNNHGDAAGACGVAQPVLWQHDGSVVMLDVLGGPGSLAFSINDALQIVGCSKYDSMLGINHAAVWDLHGGLTDINLAGMDSSVAYDINSSGLIVGTCNAGSTGYAVKWVLVPEPSAFAAVFLGCVGLLARRRRR